MGITQIYTDASLTGFRSHRKELKSYFKCKDKSSYMLIQEWYTPIIPGLWRLRLEDCEFKVSLDYIARV